MALRLAGHLIIGSATPGEDPVTVGYVWMDTGTSKLKICTSVSPYTWVEVGGAGGASVWGGITGTLSDQTDLQTALNAKAASVHTHVESDVTNLVTDLVAKAALVHATRHQSGGADPIALDTLAAPTDIAMLNASTSAHGLMQKYPNTLNTVLRGDGSFATSFTKDAAYTWTWEAFGGFEFIGRNGNNVLADPRRSTIGDVLLRFQGRGYFAPDDVTVAAISSTNSAGFSFKATDDFTAAARGGKIEFSTVLNGTNSSLLRWTIDHDGALTPTSPAYLNVKLDALQAPTDVVTLNASTAAHGLLKKLSNVATEFMDGTGAWDTIKDSDLSTSDITTNDVTTAKHGFMSKLPGGTTTYYRADGTFAAVTATPPVLVGPNNLVSTVEAIAANTFVHVGRQLEIAATGSIEIPSTSTLEISA